MHWCLICADIVYTWWNVCTVVKHRQGLCPQGICTFVAGDNYTYVMHNKFVNKENAIKDIKESDIMKQLPQIK